MFRVCVCLCVRMSTIGTHFFNFFSVQRPIVTKLGSKNHWPKTHMWVHFGWGRRSSRGQYGSFYQPSTLGWIFLSCARPIVTKLRSKNHWHETHVWVNFGWDRRLFRGQYGSVFHKYPNFHYNWWCNHVVCLTQYEWYVVFGIQVVYCLYVFSKQSSANSNMFGAAH